MSKKLSKGIEPDGKTEGAESGSGDAPATELMQCPSPALSTPEEKSESMSVLDLIATSM